MVGKELFGGFQGPQNVLFSSLKNGPKYVLLKKIILSMRGFFANVYTYNILDNTF